MRMDSWRKIRERLELNHYYMAKRLGVSQSSYKHLEEKAEGMRLPLFLRHRELALEAGFTEKQWLKLLIEDADKMGKTLKGRKTVIK